MWCSTRTADRFVPFFLEARALLLAVSSISAADRMGIFFLFQSYGNWSFNEIKKSPPRDVFRGWVTELLDLRRPHFGIYVNFRILSQVGLAFVRKTKSVSMRGKF